MEDTLSNADGEGGASTSRGATFHPFPKLPAELRLKIWQDALLDLPGFFLDVINLRPVEMGLFDGTGDDAQGNSSGDTTDPDEENPVGAIDEHAGGQTGELPSTEDAGTGEGGIQEELESDDEVAESDDDDDPGMGSHHWNLVNNPQLIDAPPGINHPIFNPDKCDCPMCRRDLDSDTAILDSRPWLPAILSAHPDVHDAARSLGCLWDGIRTEGPAWFHPSKDALFFTVAKPKLALAHPRFDELCKRAEKVAVTETHLLLQSFIEDVADYERFPSIRTVIVVPWWAELERTGLVIETPEMAPPAGHLPICEMFITPRTTTNSLDSSSPTTSRSMTFSTDVSKKRAHGLMLGGALATENIEKYFGSTLRFHWMMIHILQSNEAPPNPARLDHPLVRRRHAIVKRVSTRFRELGSNFETKTMKQMKKAMKTKDWVTFVTFVDPDRESSEEDLSDGSGWEDIEVD